MADKKDKTPQEGGKSPWAQDAAPFGRTKTGRPRKQAPTNPTGKSGPRKKQGATTRGRGKNANVDTANWRKEVRRRDIKFDDDQKQVFCDTLAENGGLLGRAAEAADTTMRTVNKHRDADPEFDKQVDDALLKHRDNIVGHHLKLVFEGEVTKRYKDGELIEEKHTFPIPLVTMELKKVDPAYRDKQTIDLNQTGGVIVAPADMSPQEWIADQEELNAKKKPPEGEGDD